MTVIPDVALPDEDPTVVYGLSHSRLEDQSLQTPLQKVLHGESQHIIELVLPFLEKSIPIHPAKKGFPLKNSTRVLLIEREKFSGRITDTAQGILDPPELSLAPKPILAHQLQLGIQPLFLIGTTGLLEGFPICKHPKLAGPREINIRSIDLQKNIRSKLNKMRNARR